MFNNGSLSVDHLFDLVIIAFVVVVFTVIAGGFLALCYHWLKANQQRRRTVAPAAMIGPNSGARGEGGHGVVISHLNKSEKDGKTSTVEHMLTPTPECTEPYYKPSLPSEALVENIAGVIVVRTSTSDGSRRPASHMAKMIRRYSQTKMAPTNYSSPESMTIDHEMEGSVGTNGGDRRHSFGSAAESTVSTAFFRNNNERAQHSRQRTQSWMDEHHGIIGGVHNNGDGQQHITEKAKEFKSSMLLLKEDEVPMPIGDQIQTIAEVHHLIRAKSEENNLGTTEGPQSARNLIKIEVQRAAGDRQNGDGDDDQGKADECGEKPKSEEESEKEEADKVEKKPLSGAAKIEQELMGISSDQLPVDREEEQKKKEELKKSIGPPEPNFE